MESLQGIARSIREVQLLLLLLTALFYLVARAASGSSLAWFLTHWLRPRRAGLVVAAAS